MTAWSHVEITCCSCGAPITLHESHVAQLRESHATFWCPNGHAQHFPGKTAQEKRIEQLERQVAGQERLAGRLEEHWRAECDMRRALVSAAQVCPLGCGHAGSRRLPHLASDEELRRFLDRVGSDLAAHLTAAHNATVKAQRPLTRGSAEASR